MSADGDHESVGTSAKPWINSFLVHRGESCNKQVSGVSLFRRGIAS